MLTTPTDLGGGLLLRRATSEDTEAIVSLSVAAHGEVERWGVSALLADPTVGPERWLVACDGDGVVSTTCLLSRRLQYGSVDIGLGQPEYVATAPGHRDRGVVRAQMEHLHDVSAAAGDLAQLIVGIPYFYRQFGYEYALSMGAMFGVRADRRLPVADDVTVRPAALDDLDSLVELNDATLRCTPVRVDRSGAGWRRLLAGGAGAPHQLVVAERSGRIVGAADVEDWKGPSVGIVDLCASERDAAPALVAHVAAQHPDRGVQVQERPGTLGWAALGDHLRPEVSYGYYVRIADPVAFLTAVAPALTDRLAASALASTSGEVVISRYRDAVRLVVERGAVVGVERCPPVQDPLDDGGVGVPPDLFATLVLGRHGARELERRHDDVTLGADGQLLDTLFAPLRSDVQLEV